MTTLLHAWRGGDDAACQELMGLLYDELRGLAGHYFRDERAGHTLQPTALVHELYLRLFSGQPLELADRGHFMAIAARQLRRLLVDHARRGSAQKRGVRVELGEALWMAPAKEASLEELSLALDKLEAVDARAVQVIELRFFGGLSETEAADALGISRSTAKRDWEFARSWLLAELGA